MQGYLSEVRMFAGNFAPLGWGFCHGQLINISENDALFSLLGTTFGGDGQITFALPDLRSRVPVHPGQGPGLSNYELGQTGGAETVTLTANNIGNHTHPVTGTAGIVSANGDGQTPIAINNFPAGNGEAIYSNSSENIFMAPASLSNLTVAPQTQGGNEPMNLLQPFLAINFIICLQGVYPSRN